MALRRLLHAVLLPLRSTPDLPRRAWGERHLHLFFGLSACAAILSAWLLPGLGAGWEWILHLVGGCLGVGAVVVALWAQHRYEKRRSYGLLCPECGYDLRGVAEGACPECGTAFTHASLRTAWGIEDPADKDKRASEDKEEDEDNASSGGRT